MGKESLRCCLVLSLLPQSKPEMIFKDWREVVIDWDHSLSHLGSEILNNSLQFQSNRSSLYNFLEEFADFMQNMELLIPTPLQNLGKNIPSRRYWKKDPWKIKGNGKWVYRMLKICLTFNKNIQVDQKYHPLTDNRPMSPEWKSASTKWVETTKTSPAATNIESLFVFVKNVKNTKSEGEWDEVRIIVDSIFG